MTKIQFVFWLIILAIIVLLVIFFKCNPLYASIETVVAFVLGLSAEWIVERVYNKWFKK